MAIDGAAMLAWVRAECEKRGCTDLQAVTRKLHDAANKASRNVSFADIQRECIEELRLAGFYLPGEKTFEESVAEAERLNPTTVVKWRSGEGGPQ